MYQTNLHLHIVKYCKVVFLVSKILCKVLFIYIVCSFAISFDLFDFKTLFKGLLELYFSSTDDHVHSKVSIAPYKKHMNTQTPNFPALQR